MYEPLTESFAIIFSRIVSQVRVLSTGGGRGEASPPNTPASPPTLLAVALTSKYLDAWISLAPSTVVHSSYYNVSRSVRTTTNNNYKCR